MKKIVQLITLVLILPALSLNAQTLVINEVDYDQPGTDNSEFIEIVNANPNVANLSSYVVMLFNGTTSAVYDSIVLPSFLLSQGQFYVICSSSGTVPNCLLTHGAASDIIQNGSPDAIAIKNRLTQVIVDALSYEGDCIAPYIEGTGTLTVQSDDNTNPGVGLSRFPDGFDSNSNSADFHFACSTPGAANVGSTASCLTGIQNIHRKNNSLFIYPNPASTLVSIFGMPSTNSRQWDVSVYDATGKLCLSSSLSSDNNIIGLNVENLSNGIYHVVISNNEYHSGQHLVVSRSDN